MPARAEPMDPWTCGRHILGEDADTPVGEVRVLGLDAVAETLAARARGIRVRSTPDIAITAITRTTIEWFIPWGNNPRTRKRFVIRDNLSNRWFDFRDAYVSGVNGQEETYTISFNNFTVDASPPTDLSTI